MTNQETKPLTDKLIKALSARKTSFRLNDGLNDPSLKGFHIQVNPSGNKTFSLSYTSPEVFDFYRNGSVKFDKRGNPVYKRRFFNLGAYPDVSLSQARDKARDNRAKINLGIDPTEEKNRQEEQQKQADLLQNKIGTVEQLFYYYIQDMRLDSKTSSDEVERIYNKDVHNAIGHLKTKDVTKKDCALVVKLAVDRGSEVMANRLRSYLHAAFNFGIYAEDEPRWVDMIPDFQLVHNPVSQTRRPLKSENVGERALSKDEINLLWTNLDTSTMNPSYILALKLLFSSGLRVRQIIEATWDELDLDENIWEVPKSRNRKGSTAAKIHTFLLTDFHISLLKELKKLSPNDYLFPNRNNDGHILDSDIARSLKRFLTMTNFEYFTLRDIRRTWKTLAASIGIDLELRNRIQGHALLDVGSKHYDRYSYLKEKRAGMERYTAWLETVIRGDSNVIPMVRRGS